MQRGNMLGGWLVVGLVLLGLTWDTGTALGGEQLNYRLKWLFNAQNIRHHTVNFGFISVPLAMS